MILFINACVKKASRTKRIAARLLEKLAADDSAIEEIKLIDVDFPKTDEDFLAWRDGCIASNDFSDKYFDLAKQFAKADTVVIAAPYYDLSFPATLKQYIEHINVMGITFEYTPEGYPEALCKADKLYYVMTAGGSFVPEEYGPGYIKSIAESFYGIKDFTLIKALGLDVYGANVEGIVSSAIESI